MNMNLKDYKMQPDEGLYEQIEKRLKVRRMARVWGSVAGVAAVCVAVVLMMTGSPADEPQETLGGAVGQAVVPEEVVQEASVDQLDTTVRQSQVVTPSAAMPQAQQVPPLHQQQAAVTLPSIGEEPAGVNVGSSTMIATEEVMASEQNGATNARESLNSNNVDVIAAPIVSFGNETVVEEEKTAAEPEVALKADPTTPVHIDDLMWAPNVIVPNGDVEENRTFKLKFTSAVTDFQVRLYNRGGRQVFVSTDPGFVWDGTHGGDALPQGAYVWIVKFRDSTGKMHQEKGTVTIIR